MSLSDLWDFIKFLAQFLFVVGLLFAVLLGCFYFVWTYGIQPQIPDPQDVYEDALNRCLARETLSLEQCEDIALKEAYD